MTTAERRTYLEAQVAGISADLKRPGLSYLERQLLHADRAEIRQMLAGFAESSVDATPTPRP